MDSDLYDSFLPSCYAPTDWHNAVLGVTASGEELRVDLRTDPHIFIVGPTGSGKSILVQRVAVSALSRGHQVVLIDTYKKGIEYARMSDWFTRTAYSREIAAATLSDLSIEVDRRYALVHEHAAAGWEEIPGLTPLTVIVEDSCELIPRDDTAASIQLHLERLTRIGQGAGVHVLLAEHTPEQVGGEIRANLPTRVLLPTPKLNLSTLQLFMSGSGARASDALKLIEGSRDRETRGLALVSTRDGSMALGQIGLIGSARVSDTLFELGVPLPTPLSAEIV